MAAVAHAPSKTAYETAGLVAQAVAFEGNDVRSTVVAVAAAVAAAIAGCMTTRVVAGTWA